jgi:YD repeat-containing protein
MRDRLLSTKGSVRALFLAAAVLSFSGALLEGQAPVTYFYDALGRLAGVVDGNGESAVYVYDAVGNLLAIERHSNGTVGIVQFTPSSGPIATTVTISGTGFSTTPSQNTLTFNGVAATVTGATATQLVATVPSGATTGTIAVTTPSGSASSGSPFTVTSSSNAPTITSFTPTIGTAGTSVTITGTNFQTTATNNRTMFNLRHAAVTSSTATTISTAVPTLAGSGRISVHTPFGGAVGDDFFIPPYPFTAADVGFTGRWDVNQASIMSIATANRIGLAVFDGTAGHQLSLRGTNSTFTGTVGCDASVSILKPDGTVLSPAGCMEGNTGFLDAVTTPITGTYTILLDPSNTASGSITLTPHDFLDVTGTIAPGGSAVTAATETGKPGQNARYTFAGTSSQRVSLRGTSGTTGQILGCDIFASIVKPDGNAIAPATCMEGSGFIDATTLPLTGTYTVLVDPAGAIAPATVTLNLYNVLPDVTGTISPGGSAVTVTTEAPGQNGILTFSGTANQRVLVIGTNGISGQVGITCDVTSTIRKPDGSTLASACMEGSGIIDTQTLPTSGTYSILVDPVLYVTGSLTLTLTNVPADVTGMITADGTLVSATNTAAGQNAIYSFSGTAGQRVSLDVGSGPLATVTIRRPNGSSLGSGTAGPWFIEPVTLLESGTHTVVVDYWGANTGTVPLRLYTVPADFTGSVSVNGGAASVSLSPPGQNGAVTFSGTANQQVTVRVTNNTIAWVKVTLRKPDGSTLTSLTSGAGSFNLSQVTLPVNGTYSIFINPDAALTGSLNVAVTSP